MKSKKKKKNLWEKGEEYQLNGDCSDDLRIQEHYNQIKWFANFTSIPSFSMYKIPKTNFSIKR